MLIFGWGFKTYKKYGVITIGVCNQCNANTKWVLAKETVWFTLFFIPIIPTKVRKLIVCVKCNQQREIENDVFEKLKKMIEMKKQSTDMSSQVDDLKYVNLTETQKNYLREMQQYKKEKELRENKDKIKVINELNIIRRSRIPYNKNYIVDELRKLGLKEGMTVIVHSSLSAIGWVNGGPIALIQGLMDVVTKEGTIVMPAHSGNYSDPAHWSNPPVPKEWIEDIKENMPAFNPKYTPTRGIGIVPEVFRTFPDVLRSNHPIYSFAAWGKEAENIISDHSLEYGLGENSPLKKLYDLDSYVLLLGTGYDSNTSFHLSEYRIEKREEENGGAPIEIDGKRVWTSFKDVELDSDDFNQIGEALEKEEKVTIGKIGNARVKLFNQKDAVDFATKWMETNRR